MAITIRQNKDSKGTIIVNWRRQNCSADDTTAVLSDTKSAKVVFELLDLLRQISGLKINPKKTEGVWISSSKESEAKPFLNIKLPNEPIKALGVYFTYDRKLFKEK